MIFNQKKKFATAFSNKNYLVNSFLVLCCMLKILLSFAYLEQEKFSALCIVRRACSKFVRAKSPSKGVGGGGGLSYERGGDARRKF